MQLFNKDIESKMNLNAHARPRVGDRCIFRVSIISEDCESLIVSHAMPGERENSIVLRLKDEKDRIHSYDWEKYGSQIQKIHSYPDTKDFKKIISKYGLQISINKSKTKKVIARVPCTNTPTTVKSSLDGMDVVRKDSKKMTNQRKRLRQTLSKKARVKIAYIGVFVF